MSLTERQYWILRAMYKNEGEFIKTSYLANSLHCTTRSIQNDLTALRTLAQQEQSFSLDTRKAYGTRMIIFDIDGFQKYLDAHSDPSSERMNNKDNRIHELFQILLSQHEPISIKQLSEAAYSSTSTIRSDLKKLSLLLSKQNLSIDIDKGNVTLNGTETARRSAILTLSSKREKQPTSLPGLWESEDHYSKILREAIEKEHLSISDYHLHHLVFFLLISLSRIADGFTLEDTNQLSLPDAAMITISKAVYNDAANAWRLTIPDQEINFLALMIPNAVTTETSTIDTKTENNQADESWIREVLTRIDATFPVHLSEDLILISQLTASIPALTERIQTKTEYDNFLSEFISSQNPLSMDIAIAFAYEMKKKTGFKLSQNEICTLSLYFLSSLYRHGFVRKKIGIITTLQPAERILLKELLLKEFGSHIDTIDFLSSYADGYDCLLSTEGHLCTRKEIAYIFYPPDHREMERIHSLITGYTPEMVLNLFSSKLFFTADIDDRHIAETYLISETSHITSSSTLSKAIEEREQLTSNYYENGVAILKPVYPLPGRSFASILLLKNGISWEPGHTVSLIILLSVSARDQQTMLACNNMGPALFEAGWRQLLNGSDRFSDLMKLFRVRLSRSLFENGMPNLKPDPWKQQ